MMVLANWNLTFRVGCRLQILDRADIDLDQRQRNDGRHQTDRHQTSGLGRGWTASGFPDRGEPVPPGRSCGGCNAAGWLSEREGRLSRSGKFDGQGYPGACRGVLLSRHGANAPPLPAAIGARAALTGLTATRLAAGRNLGWVERGRHGAAAQEVFIFLKPQICYIVLDETAKMTKQFSRMAVFIPAYSIPLEHCFKMTILRLSFLVMVSRLKPHIV
jgi:hypothetical protein